MIRASTAVGAMLLVLLVSGAAEAAEGAGGDPERGAFRPEVATEVFPPQQGADSPFPAEVDIDPRLRDPFGAQLTVPSEAAERPGDEPEIDANGSATQYRQD